MQILLGDGKVVAKIPNRNGSVAFERGQTVALSWHADDCQAFPAPSHTMDNLAQSGAALETADPPAWLPAAPLTNW